MGVCVGCSYKLKRKSELDSEEDEFSDSLSRKAFTGKSMKTRDTLRPSSSIGSEEFESKVRPKKRLSGLILSAVISRDKKKLNETS